MAQRNMMLEDDRSLLETKQASDSPKPDLQVHFQGSKIYTRVKRAMDIVLSGIALALFSPFLLVLALVICLDDPHGGPIFVQDRVGKDERVFRLYKLRTMRVNTPPNMATAEVLCPEMYITRVGGFLRRFSLDELAQLMNVVKGDMSLIGPRPLIPEEREIHDLRKRCGVYQVRPGVTGLAQIRGRDLVTPAEKVRLDVKYLKHFGFRQDFEIFLATLPKIISADGVVEGCAKPERRAPLRYPAQGGQNLVERD